MPRVVIELQANTQEAVNKIQQFARAQKDAFDAIKVGNATLADARSRTAHLITGLRRHRKKSRLLGETLKSLRQLKLQEVAE